MSGAPRPPQLCGFVEEGREVAQDLGRGDVVEMANAKLRSRRVTLRASRVAVSPIAGGCVVDPDAFDPLLGNPLTAIPESMLTTGRHTHPK